MSLKGPSIMDLPITPKKTPFVNREELFKWVDNFWLNTDPVPQILMLHGMGGIGKSRFIEEVIARHKHKREKIIAIVNFNTPDYRSCPPCLFQLRIQLAKYLDISFNNFDFVYAVYFHTTRPMYSMEEDIALVEKTSILYDIAAGVGKGLVTGIEVLPLINKVMIAYSKGKKGLQKWWRRRQPAFQKFEQLAREKKIQEMQYYLPVFLEEDLKEAKKKNPDQQILAILDTYENLWEDKGRTIFLHHQIDLWVQKMVLALPSVKWLISGQKKIRWEKLDAQWENHIDKVLMGDLLENDCKRLLKLSGIKGEWIGPITKRSHGVPLYIELAIKIYERAEKNKIHISLDDFKPKLPYLLQRFLKQLNQEEEETLFLLAVPRYWTNDLWTVLKTQFNPKMTSIYYEEFCRYEFINLDGQGRYTLHSLIRDSLLEFMRIQYLAQLERRHLFVSDYYAKLAHIDDIKQVESAHIVSLQESVYHRVQLCEKITFESLSEWFWTRTDPYNNAGFWSTILPLAQEIYKKLQKNTEVNKSLIAENSNNLAMLLKNMGQYEEAKPLFERALDIYEKALGPDHPDTGASLNHLAELLQDMGQYEEAKPLYERALDIVEKALGPDHPHTGATLNHLAELLQDMGQYEEAKLLLERAQDIYEKALGPDHPHTGISLNNLAELMHKMGQYEEAKPLLERALDIVEKALGPNHPHTGASLNKLAELMQDMGQYEEAKPQYERALDIVEKALGPDHPETGATLNHLASLLYKMGQYKEAKPLFERALDIYEKVLGPDHPHTGTSLNNLAELLQDMGQYEEAKLLLERALDIVEKALGPNHPHTGASLNNLALLVYKMGQYEEAKPLLERALDIREKTLGPNHPDTGASLNHLALLLVDMEQYEEVEPLYERALDIVEKALGPDHPHTGTTLNNLASLWQKMGQYELAKLLYERVLDIYEKALGPDHPRTGTTLNNLAESLKEMGQYEEAKPLIERALDIYKKVLGPDHPDTNIIRSNLRLIIKQQKQNLNKDQ